MVSNTIPSTPLPSPASLIAQPPVMIIPSMIIIMVTKAELLGLVKDSRVLGWKGKQLS